jgi:uncharacterized 2Fe-2S/4Fe-4S cluster protein (DUF4445 family)
LPSQDKVLIEIIENGHVLQYETSKGMTLLKAMQDLGIKVFSPCGGNGKCGKCKVMVDGEKAWRLACKVLLNEDIKIHKPYVTGSANIMQFGIGIKNELCKPAPEGKMFGIAVDIGTTTVVLYLTDLDSGKLIDVEAKLNPQAAVGADVISRINYSVSRSDGLGEMKKLVISCINEMLEAVTERNKLDVQRVIRAVISGNTTMLHIFLGLEIQSMGIYPFTPVTIESVSRMPKQVGLNINPSGNVLTLPSVSAFIGADIIAGILAVEMHKADKHCLLIDLGTNGEMVIGNKNGMFACAAAMGPAFEGAGTEFGTASISGAINTVSINEMGVFYDTIDNVEAIGICGSAIIDIVAGMLNHGVIDNSGRFIDKDNLDKKTEISILKDRIVSFKGKTALLIARKIDETPIVFTQKDVREVQLAKAAIATGIQVLMNKVGINAQDIGKIYLAGGFGSFIDIINAIRISLIPESFKDKIVPAGNTAGAGTVRVLLDQEATGECERIKEMVSYFDLASAENFQDMYINNLSF